MVKAQSDRIKLKVIFTIDSLKSGGTERSLAHLINNFSNNLKCTVVLFYSNKELLPLYNAFGITTIFIDLKGQYNFYRGIVRLKKIIEQEQPDLVVSSLYKSDIMTRIACRLTKTPLIDTLVDDTYSRFRLRSMSLSGRAKVYFFWLLNLLTSRIPTHWIANAKSIAKSNARALLLNEANISVVYRGRAYSHDKVWEYQSLDQSRFHFISYGRLLERKGFAELLKAFARVQKRHPASFLTIYGEGEYSLDLENLTYSLGLSNCVFLPGKIPNVENKLLDAHCFVFPSWYEGFSGALVEAMMVGIPIIASDIPMNLEAVTSNEHALTFKAKDELDLAEKMIWAIEHPEEMVTLGRKARESAIRRFDIKVIAREYEKVLNEVL